MSKISKWKGLDPSAQLFADYRPHLDYGDMFYDQTYNTSFHQKF